MRPLVITLLAALIHYAPPGTDLGQRGHLARAAITHQALSSLSGPVEFQDIDQDYHENKNKN